MFVLKCRKSTFGACYTLSQVVEKIGEKIGDEQTQVSYFNDFVTSHYKLNYFKLPTGLSFILLTSINNMNFIKVLKSVYSNIYVELVCKNPLA